MRRIFAPLLALTISGCMTVGMLAPEGTVKTSHAIGGGLLFDFALAGAANAVQGTAADDTEGNDYWTFAIVGIGIDAIAATAVWYLRRRQPAE